MKLFKRRSISAAPFGGQRSNRSRSRNRDRKREKINEILSFWSDLFEQSRRMSKRGYLIRNTFFFSSLIPGWIAGCNRLESKSEDCWCWWCWRQKLEEEPHSSRVFRKLNHCLRFFFLPADVCSFPPAPRPLFFFKLFFSFNISVAIARVREVISAFSGENHLPYLSRRRCSQEAKYVATSRRLARLLI